jgi:ferrous iron transport protein B
MTQKYIIGVVGNPNCGKTTLFNALTGAKQRVGNWPGVTVERKTGRYNYNGTRFELVDLPGTYSLDVSEPDVSVDEQIARDYVAAREADLIINIVDASNIERNLYLTAQLIEMKVPMVIALNMMDIAEERGILIDVGGLSEHIGCPVMPVVASKGKGITELKRVILKAVRDKPIPQVTVHYAPELEQALETLMPEIIPVASQHHSDPRWLAVRLLEGDTLALKMAGSQVNKTLNTLRANTEKAIEDDLDISVADSRYGFVDAITKQTITKASQVKRSTSDKIDRVVLNRALGIPIFLAVMYLMFMFTINIGGAFIDFFDMFTTTLLVDGLGEWMNSLGSPEWLTVLVAKGIGGGIVVVATFIPIIGFLYLFLSVLEDSGYTARAAFVMDRFMRFIGLPGKAFVPMMVGFGCNVPAIMATRTMEHQRDRILTILMNPFMSCGARLPVYALFAAAFFPVGGQNLVFGLYLWGIAAAVMTGLIMKNTVLQGETAPFVMELPPYHLPTFRGGLLRTWDRLKTFIFRAGKVIVPMVLVINFLNALGTDGSFGNEDSDTSLLSEIGREIVPAFSPMGLEEDNWPAAVGIFTGVLAKEVVVGTLDALYTSLAESDARAADRAEPEEEAFDLWARISEALATIPANLAKVVGMATDPLGLDIGDVSNVESAAEAQEVNSGTFGAMQARFDGQAGAFSYLLFILLYFPCVAATAAIYREAGTGWTIFVAAWTTGLAYMVATIFYQAATMNQHLNNSSAWIGGMLTVFIGVVLALRYWSRRPGTTQLSFPRKA